MSIKRYFLYILFLMSLGGCVQPQPAQPSLSDQQMALKLIDQGTFHLRNQKLSEARASFEIAYDLHNTAVALDGLGSVAFMAGDLVEARDYYIAAYELDPEYSRSLSHLALLYDYIGEKRAASHLYRRALQESPDDGMNRSNHGVLLYEQRYFDEAKEEFFRAYSVTPHETIAINMKKMKSLEEKGRLR